jgi:hypothetical protein
MLGQIVQAAQNLTAERVDKAIAQATVRTLRKDQSKVLKRAAVAAKLATRLSEEVRPFFLKLLKLLGIELE